MRKDYSKKKHKSHKGDTAFDYNFLHQKSTSEPDLSDSTPRGTDRWTIRFPHEFITVDELAYYRRRKPPDQHTKSSICLYNKSEPSIPFSAFKSEYNRRYIEQPLSPRPHLERRSTSLKLDGSMIGESESKSVFHPYTDTELLRCRPSMIKLPQNLYLTGNLDMQPEYRTSYGIPQLYKPGDTVVAAAGLATKTNYFPSISPTPINTTIRTETSKSESALNKLLSKKNSLTDDMTEVSNNKGLLGRKCNLRLEGELSYLPEYRSQFIQYPIEKSHSIPQLSNIKLHGEFTAVPEYRANYKIYDNFTKSAPIKKKDNLYLQGSITGMAEYTDNYKTPLMPSKFKSIKSTDSHIGKNENNFKNEYLPEYYESYKHPHVSIKPERAKPKEPFLSLRGKTEYNPEYRCTYLDFPRSRHIVKKPDSSFKLANSGKASDRQDGSLLKKRDSVHERRLSIHDVPPATVPMDPDLPFVCLPEYRKVKKDLQIRERRPMSRGSDEQQVPHDINNNPAVVSLPEIPKSGRSSGRSSSTRRSSLVKPLQSRTTSPTFRLLVENVDDHRGTFRRSKSSPKFGRRSIVGMPVHPPNGPTFTTSSDSEHIPTTQSLYNLRNRTRVIEGNPNYVNDTTEYYKRQKKHVVDANQANSRNEAPSFIVLKEPCKQSGWMRPTWYDS